MSGKRWEIVSEGYLYTLATAAISNLPLKSAFTKLTSGWESTENSRAAATSLRYHERRTGHVYMDVLVGRLIDDELAEGTYDAELAGRWAEILRNKTEALQLYKHAGTEPWYLYRNNDGDVVIVRPILIDALQTIADNGWCFFLRDLGND